MPLTLVTGPANAEKAGVLLDALRAQPAEEPILVVPTRADAIHYRRELAGAGLVLGARVERFDGLIAEAAARCEIAGRPLGRVARERVAAAAVGATRLDVLAQPARGPGFAAALLALIADLEAARIDPPRLTQALREWAGDGPRRAYADELAALYGAYRRLLERLGRNDPELYARAVLDALRLAPRRWRGTAVYFYGFDDFTAIELDAIETLAKVVDAPVTVALPYERGRLAFAGRAGTHQTLSALADARVELEARDDHYAPGARRPLHHLERGLFEHDRSRLDPGAAIALLEGGGERAELELVAAEVRALLGAGVEPEQIAVVLRSPAAHAPLIEDVFAAAGLACTLARRVRFADTALGRGALALLRIALLDGDAAQLAAWLRTPGVVGEPALVDRFEAEALRQGLDAAAAIELWERLGWPLDAVARLRQAVARSPLALLEATSDELERLFARPRRRAAAVLDGFELDDARALAAGRRTLADLLELANAVPRLAPGARELVATLEAIELAPEASEAAPGTILVTDPLALRARRVRALVACRLQEGTFPQQLRPPPFFSERERREIAAASGLALPAQPDSLHAERHLFYAMISRPTERLVLSWHVADDDGQPAQRSLFVDDVCDLFEQSLFDRRARRAIAAVDGAVRVDAATAPPAGARGAAVGPLTDPVVLAQLRGRGVWSASSLELWSRCPVRWLVERQLGAEDLEPEPEPLVRGRFVHDVLRQVFEQLAHERGSARVDGPALRTARALLRDALAQLAPAYRISVNGDRLRAAVREVELDLERYFDQCVKWGGAYEPRHFELLFGYGPEGRADDDPAHALRLAGGRVPLHGRIDRIDVESGDASARAIVYDYKGRSVEKPDDWLERRTLQLPLYMIAAEQLLGVDPVGGFYQPIGALPDHRKARGVLAAGADDAIDCVRGDRRDADEVRELLDAVVALAVEAVAELEAGAVESRPRTCTRDGGCAHPSICRLEAA